MLCYWLENENAYYTLTQSINPKDPEKIRNFILARCLNQLITVDLKFKNVKSSPQTSKTQKTKENKEKGKQQE